jgi:DNA-binding XRE family transcriptional regulator
MEDKKTMDNKETENGFALIRKRRETTCLNQSQAAKFFGLEGSRSRESYGLWENGKKTPGLEHRSKWIQFLLEPLNFSDAPELFVEIWHDIAIKKWGYARLDITELPPGFPGELLLENIPFQVPQALPYFVGRSDIFRRAGIVC